jgi:hypothetical protein
MQIPFKVLSTWTISRGGTSVAQVLVSWSGFNDALSTWEDYNAIQQQFFRSATWRQAASQAGGDVSNAPLLVHNTADSTDLEPLRLVGRSTKRLNTLYSGPENHGICMSTFFSLHTGEIRKPRHLHRGRRMLHLMEWKIPVLHHTSR